MVVSKYVHHVRSETIRVDKPHAAQAEVSAIIDVGIAMRALISSCEYFTRSAGFEISEVVESSDIYTIVHVWLRFYEYS